ncbi:hypothetical protein TWF694_002277 [Orbilia ellipsospora]|uniref:Peptidase S8/S53 domain-containing protein n=1 Tax=Orbilia ellipsospora TaxID=2528407 RepID=A0AAV9X1G6_9PEZI
MKSGGILIPFLLSLVVIPAALAAPAAQKSEDNATDKYIVMLAEDEKRPWKEIFSDLGIKAKENKNFKASSYGRNAQISSWNSDESGHIVSSGTHIRTFTLKMKRSESTRILSHSSIVAVDPVRPVSYDVHINTDYIPSNKTISYDPLDLEKRQQGYYNNNNQQQQLYNSNNQQQDSNSQDQTQKPTKHQKTAPWNLERISTGRKVKQHSSVTSLDYTYTFKQGDGTGVDVYILDTGLYAQHKDFGGRAKSLWSFARDNALDVEGHGTHCAGTVGSNTYGVAKGANLWGVKILGKGSDSSTVIQGMEAVLAQHNKRKSDPNFRGSVISASFSNVGEYKAEFEAFKRVIAAGIHVAVSAGNEGRDACLNRPARYSKQLPIVTVGASDIKDALMSLKNNFKSNYGQCVTVHGPGVDIISTWKDGVDSTYSMSGTSMSAPAVAGMIAVELSRKSNLKLNPKGMRDYLLSQSLPNVVQGASGGSAMINNGFKQ